MFDVNEIFYSIEGEGIRAGYPCVFVRFNGCNLRCEYCDTEYAQCSGPKGAEMSISDIIKEVEKFGCPRVTLTGGEPCYQEGIQDLCRVLAEEDFEVNIETNGTIDADALFVGIPRPLITMDYKSISSMMNHEMSLDSFYGLHSTDVLKFVVGTKEDMVDAVRVIKALEIKGVTPHIFFSPVFGSMEAKDIVEFLKEYGLTQCRVQLQLHKFIWPPEQRGV